jgi:hypothetical protein
VFFSLRSSSNNIMSHTDYITTEQRRSPRFFAPVRRRLIDKRLTVGLRLDFNVEQVPYSTRLVPHVTVKDGKMDVAGGKESIGVDRGGAGNPWRNLDAEGMRDRCELHGDMETMPFRDSAFDLVVNASPFTLGLPTWRNLDWSTLSPTLAMPETFSSKAVLTTRGSSVSYPAPPNGPPARVQSNIRTGTYVWREFRIQDGSSSLHAFRGQVPLRARGT